jgi:2-iminobutanoate/2-iminopropanoate deaminase
MVEYLNSFKNLAKPVGPYSQAVRVGDFLFFSGQLAFNPQTQEFVKSDVSNESNLILNNFKNALDELNLSLENVVKVTIYTTELNKFSELNSIYTKFFDKTYPARTTIEVSALPLNASVEMEFVVYAPQTKT